MWGKKVFAFLLIFTLFSVVLKITPISASVRSEMGKLAEEITKEYKNKVKEILFKKRLAIFNFKNITPETKKYNVGEALSSILTTKMSESLIFILIEREEVKKIADELELGMSGLIDEKSAPKAGKLLGAELILTGTVSEIGDNINVDTKLISVETGEILVTKSINLPKSEVISESKQYQWSSFQSKYGISIGANKGNISPSNEKYKGDSIFYSVDVMYRFTSYLKVGLGYYSFIADELLEERFKFSSFSNIIRYYRFDGSGIKINIEVIQSIFNWFNAGIRLEYIPLGGVLTQDLVDFPVYVSTGSTNKLMSYRFNVKSWQHNIMNIFNLDINLDFLISKRASLNFQIGYTFTSDFIPDGFNAAGHIQDSNDFNNGVFPEFQNFDFSKHNVNGEPIKLNFSGFNFKFGFSVHF